MFGYSTRSGFIEGHCTRRRLRVPEQVAGGNNVVVVFSCKQCTEACQLSGSKPTGKDPRIRIEDVCALNRRNMEKRVSRRKAATDPLRVYWNSILSCKDKLAVWSRRMKRRKATERVDVEMEVINEEVRVIKSNNTARQEFYGFDSIVEDFPLETEANLLKIWKKRVENAKHKIERGGETFIGKATKILVDESESKSFETRAQKSTTCNDAAQVEEAVKDAAFQRERFMKVTRQERPTIQPEPLPCDAVVPDADTGNITAALERTMSASSLVNSTVREMNAFAAQLATQDDEDMADITAAQERVPKAPTKKVQDIVTMRTSFQTQSIERIAKLESSVITLRQELASTSDPNYDHVPDEHVKEATAREFDAMELAVRGKLDAYRDKVGDFSKKFVAVDMLLKSGMTADEIAAVIAAADVEYKAFFGKGHQDEFRALLRCYKKKIESLAKDAVRLEQANAMRSSKKRKAVEVDDPEDDLPPVAKDLMQQKNLDFASVGMGGIVEYPGKTVLIVDHPKLETIGTLAQFITTRKWAATQCKKEKLSDITSQLMNKKLLGTMTDVFKGKVDSRIDPDSFKLNLGEAHAELLNSLKAPQIHYMDNHFSVNISPFGFQTSAK